MQKFRDIVHEYAPMLYWHIRRIVISHEDAEDVLQETFVKAYQRLWALRNPDALKTWLYRIATNEAHRALAKRRSRGTEDLTQVLESELSGGNTVHDSSVESEIKLQKALARMTDLQRDVFCLRYYEEMDYRQIADICGSSEGSVKVLYHKAKETVKAIIEE